MKYLTVGICIWNFIVFWLYGIDKYKAVKHKYRISERLLLFVTFFFGGAGAVFGMNIFRHKTKHISFKIVSAAGVIMIALIMSYSAVKMR